jgi:hypothetical protein
MRSIKPIGFLVMFTGIIIGFLNNLGVFENNSRIMFAEQIMNTQDAIPHSIAGFEAFLSAFPPKDADPASVTHIADKELCLSSNSDVGSTMVYIANGKRIPKGSRDLIKSEHGHILRPITGGV